MGALNETLSQFICIHALPIHAVAVAPLYPSDTSNFSFHYIEMRFARI